VAAAIAQRSLRKRIDGRRVASRGDSGLPIRSPSLRPAPRLRLRAIKAGARSDRSQSRSSSSRASLGS
jgi:hypothetical protein